MQERLPIKYLRYESVNAEMALAGEEAHLLYLISGRFRLESEMAITAYEAGDFSYVSEDSKFVLKPDGGSEFIHIALDRDFIRDCLGDYRYIICDSVREPNNDYSQLRSITADISSMYAEDKEKYNLRIFSLLFKLMDILREDFSVEGIEETELSDKYLQRVREITNYIENNYSAAVTLESLAENLFLTPQYLSLFFKKYLHCSFRDYLREKRLFHACRDLSFTDDAIGTVAQKNGFSSAAVFSRTFSETYGKSPGEFREESRAERNRLEKRGVGKVKKLNTPNEIEIRVRHEEGSFFGINEKILNASSVQNLTKAEFLESIRDCRKDLDIKYLRIQGLLSSSFIPKVIPEYTYYFSSLDRVIGEINSMNLIPWIEISNMISVNPENIFSPKGEIMGTYRLYGERFFEMLEAVLAHLTKVFSNLWLKDWVFEAWKSPHQSKEQYIKSFVKIRNLIKKYIPDATVGGPGFAINDDPNELSELLKFAKKTDTRLDFLSVYGNLVASNKKGPMLPMADSGKMADRLASFRDIVKKEYGDIPFFMTEWNSFGIENMPVQHSCYQAAFVAKTMLEMTDITDLSGYLYFREDAADTISLMKSSVTNNFWGYGLIDKNGIKSPAYYSFLFLNQLGSYLLEKGDGYCVTRETDESYRILLYGYAHVESSNFLKLNEDSSFDEVYDLFEKYGRKHVRINIEIGESGKYRIERYRLNRGNGSLLDLWIGSFEAGTLSEREFLSRVQPPIENQIDYYKKACIPEYRVLYQEASELLSIDYDLEAHEVCFYKITRLF
ncbi:MAG: helix-turn-helix domain-containing protein [Lachnospiraceae bacterium]|nr:helix-turn-helix domain-containing protein [Lachnospiraceae bacterium]